MTLRVALGIVGLLCATTLVVRAEDWTQFRGEGGCAVSREANLPSEWGVDKNIQWKTAVPGVAWSCPIIIGGNLLLRGTDQLYCIRNPAEK